MPKKITAKTSSKTGPKKMSDISAARLAELHAGAPSTHLVENMAMDFAALMEATLPEIGPAAIGQLRAAASLGITQRMALAGKLCYERFGEAGLEPLRVHRSDTVRGWACYMLAAQPPSPKCTLARRLTLLRPLADDAHFGVREWAWIALRPHLAAELENAIALLAPWTGEASERLRRFASEALRPRGVWCAHIAALKATPALGLPLLAPLRADASHYVQDSVANWLNDAAKTQPEWVHALTTRWLAESPCAATERIVTRALRSLRRT